MEERQRTGKEIERNGGVVLKGRTVRTEREWIT